MNLEIIKSEGLSHNSYFLLDENEAVVIDPRRDCEIYTQLARQNCSDIKYILETHRNEDFVIGSLELQNVCEAQIAHGKELNFKYGEHSLTNGDTLNVGNIKIKAVSTPGHTNESVCYIVYASGSSEPILVFTGDTLFSGSVGRTDLLGKPNQSAQAEKLYFSLHEKVLPLGDGLLVYPAHGAGSVCGHGISGQEPTTIGYEKKTNPYLQLSKQEFIQKCLSDEFIVPKYFRKMEEYNLNGAPLLNQVSLPRPLSLSEFEEQVQNPLVLVMDTRSPYAYAGSHIPNCFNIWLGGTSVYPGWLLDINQNIVFVNERPEDIETLTRRLNRLGFDNLYGYLCGGMNHWQEAGNSISSTRTLPVMELKSKMEKQEVALLDVREPIEWREDGYIESAKLVFFADLPENINSLPRNKSIAVTCSVGNRSSIAISMLERAGVKDTLNVLGGMTAWTALNLPIKK